jgi:type II secretory pathway component PulF
LISDRRLLLLCRDLAAAVRSGSAIEGLIEPEKGRAIHETMSERGGYPPVLIALVRAGEEGGKLPDFLDRFAECLEVRIEFRRRLTRVLAYPAFTCGAAAVIFFAFSLFALPLLGELSSGSGAAPVFAPTEAARWIVARAELVGASLLFAWAALTALSRSGLGRRGWSLASHWAPGFRFATVHGRCDVLATTMSLLLETGLPATALMEVLVQLFEDDPVWRAALSRAYKAVASGQSFAASVAGLLPEEDRRSLENAEKAGRLPDALRMLAKSHRDAQQHRLALLANAAQMGSVFLIVALVGGLIWTALQPATAFLSDPGILLR